MQGRQDIHSTYFLDTLESHNLIDVEPIVKRSTWYNNRGKDEGIHKRLDTFLAQASLFQDLVNYRSWVGPIHFSNHQPIFLELGCTEERLGSPSKYNSGWASIEEYKKLVHDTWTPFQEDKDLSANEHFVQNQHSLKKKTLVWATKYKQSNDIEINLIEKELEEI